MLVAVYMAGSTGAACAALGVLLYYLLGEPASRRERWRGKFIHRLLSEHSMGDVERIMALVTREGPPEDP